MIDRRDFLKSGVVAGIAVTIATPGGRALAALFEDDRLRPLARDAATGRIRHRIDAIAKVTGEKIFSFDMRARDLAGWPREQSHAMLLRVTQADRLYAGFDLSALEEDLRPDRIVTAADLARDGVAFPPFYGDDLLLPEGRTPAYLGQAVACLIWNDFPRIRAAKTLIRSRYDLIRWGERTGPLERAPWASFRYVRVGGVTPFDDDAYSSLKDTPLFPSGHRKQVPQWPRPDLGGSLDARGMAHAEAVLQQLESPAAGRLVLEREYFSQSIDTAAFEPDNGNGWFDAATGALHLVVATQSPQEIAEDGAKLLAAATIGVKRLVLLPCYTVGYGSKDHNPFAFYALVAGLYGDGRPVRLANDRYEQFQSSLKRHSFRMKYRIAVDRVSGRFDILQGEFQGDGGGRRNFSPSVCIVAATAAQSVYYFPQSDLASTVIASRALDAGSARGYGTLQSMSATEMLIDEVAEELKLDAIELRQRNVLKTGIMKNTQGAIATAARNPTRLRIPPSATVSASVACRKISAPARKPPSPRCPFLPKAGSGYGTSRSSSVPAWRPHKPRSAFPGSAARQTRSGPRKPNGRNCRWSRRGIPGSCGRTNRIAACPIPTDSASRDAFEREQFSLFLRPCDEGSRAARVDRRPVAGGAVAVGRGFRRRSTCAARGATRGRALGRRLAHGRRSRSALARSAREARV